MGFTRTEVGAVGFSAAPGSETGLNFQFASGVGNFGDTMVAHYVAQLLTFLGGRSWHRTRNARSRLDANFTVSRKVEFGVPVPAFWN